MSAGQTAGIVFIQKSTFQFLPSSGDVTLIMMKFGVDYFMPKPHPHWCRGWVWDPKIVYIFYTKFRCIHVP